MNNRKRGKKLQVNKDPDSEGRYKVLELETNCKLKQLKHECP